MPESRPEAAGEAPQLVETAPPPPPQPIVEAEPAPPPAQTAPAPVADTPTDRPVPLPDQSPAPTYPPAALRRGDSGTVVVQAVVDVAGGERVGVRLAPLTTLQGAVDDTPQATYLAAAHLLGELGVGYLHIAEADWEDAPLMPVAFKQALRMIYPGTLIYAGKYTAERAAQALAVPLFEDLWAQEERRGLPRRSGIDLG
jgi:hypothetical protein